MIAENLTNVKNNIKEACLKAGRDVSEVTLVAVSKMKPSEDILEAYDAGIRVFGENYVQELAEKMEELPDDIKWHMIGHLQRNKVKYIVGRVDMIHSVDSRRLAQEISERSLKLGKVTDILAQINMAGEESKFGLRPDEATDFAIAVSEMKGIRLRGLMTSAPFVEDAEKNRNIFRSMKDLSVDIMKKNIDNVLMDTLSMGMTADYKVAIEEGATLVRVGTAVFGERNYGGLR